MADDPPVSDIALLTRFILAEEQKRGLLQSDPELYRSFCRIRAWLSERHQIND
jgi:hypothetical protein